MDEVLDSQIVAEHVGFLDNCFDNSFSVQCSLVAVKEYVNEETENSSFMQKTKGQTSKKCNYTVLNKSNILDSTALKPCLSQPLKQTNINRKLKAWGLPTEIARKYEERGITEMFEWQATCLANSKVLLDCCNLVYSAPTSAGKTMVAEILTIKTILERQKKVIIILPFVSIVREKMFYLQDILSSSGIRVEGFMGSQSPPGGLQAVHIAICTIEKANSLVNRLLDEGNISELGAVIVDELHLLGDSHRGYILELLLTKIKYVSMKTDVQIQIIGMSATLPNLDILAKWLSAELFLTQFRPIPLDEFCLVGNNFYDKSGKCVNTLQVVDSPVNSSDNVLNICLNTIKDGCSILIFCMTKNRCENLAQSLATTFYNLGCQQCESGCILREQLNSDKISEVLEQLKNCPVGLDQVLMKTISFGVAYHHAGLTFDERDIIEGAFKSGAIRVLLATSTLSSGVNLPARVVVIRSPVFMREPINILTYKQMAGRAGRMGKDSKGESILICTEAEKKIGLDLMMGALDPVKSCLGSDDKYMRAVLEMIASQVVCTKEDLDMYSKCTLLATQQDGNVSQDNLMEKTLRELKNYELVRLQEDGDKIHYVATPLGKACLSASMAPNDGLSLFLELQKARQCLVLETDLHLIYLVTPYSVSSQWGDIDWLHLLTLWESLTKAMKRVGELVGIQESFIIRCLRGTKKVNNDQKKLNIHKRFYTALALQDLVNEIPLSEVAIKFQCARGFLQSLQQAAATFAGMVTAFCHQLGWKNMEILVSQFQDRLHFGIHSELLELMKLSSLNGVRARALFDSGFETITSIASADINVIENVLHKAVPFQSEKERENDDSDDVRKRNKIKSIWITGCCGMTAREAAQNLIKEARKYLQNEIGVTNIKWKNDIETDSGCKSFENNVDKLELLQNVERETQNKSLTDNEEEKQKSEILNKSRKVSINILDNSSDEMYSTTNAIQTQIKPENDSYITEDVKYNENLGFKQEFKTIDKNMICIKNEITKTETITNSTNHVVKEEIIWDSLNFTEAAINNITNLKTSEKTFSPNMSFGDADKSSISVNIPDENASSKCTSIKDASLFSSDCDSSIFEDSLPLDQISSKLLDNQSSPVIPWKRESSKDFVNIASKTIMNGFQSPLVLTDEDEDFKLVYDNISQEQNLAKTDKVISTQEKVAELVTGEFKSPLKRRVSVDANSKPKAKNRKLNNCLTNYLNSSKSHLNFTHSLQTVIKIKNFSFNCLIVTGTEVYNAIKTFSDVEGLALYLCIERENNNINDIIGRNILNIQQTEIRDVAPVKGIAVCINENTCFYLDITNFKKATMGEKITIKSWLGNNKTKFKTFSSKWCYLYLKKWLDISLAASCEDIKLTEWMIDSEERKIDIEYLVKRYYHFELSSTSVKVENRKEIYGKEDMSADACVKSCCVWLIAQKQEEYLRSKNVIPRDIRCTQNHIAIILAKCELHGIRVDRELASQMLLEVNRALECLQKMADKLAGQKINLNSSKAVAKVLGMARNGISKVSTKKSILTCHSSPLSSVVIYWRKLNSILTKTLYPLTEKAHGCSEDDRVRPSYTMHTCTGRISMHEPNLQNVPRTFYVPTVYLRDTAIDTRASKNLRVNDQMNLRISDNMNLKVNDKTSLRVNDNMNLRVNDQMNLRINDDMILRSNKSENKEFNCRHIFKASPGHVMVSADYCQLEMRILTHFSEDAVLLRIMRSGQDVFKSIASAWSNSCVDEVDDDLRQKAKQLCYGILYGMGNKTLSQHLDVTELEAAFFMDSFFKTFPDVKQYTMKLVEECRKKGYAETLMKRRRYLPNISAVRPSLKSAAERQAVNTTIQGSAADIAKAAMCTIDTINNPNYEPKLLLQMHDELIYEVPEKYKEDFMKTLKKAMEDTIKLKVPLPVKVKCGYSWGTLEEIKFF